MLGQEIVTSIGLALDIVGALLVAWEVIRRYKGIPWQDATGGALGSVPVLERVPKFATHEREVKRWAVWGLGCLALGFGFQLLGTWWPTLCRCGRFAQWLPVLCH